MSETVKSRLQAQAEQSVLPESMRQLYLKAMDIQTWYDPTLVFEVAEVSPREENKAETTEHDLQQIPVSSEPLVQQSSLEDQQVLNSEPLTLKSSTIESLNLEIEHCQLCELHTSRTKAVAGEGDTAAKLMIICVAPIEEGETNNVLFKPQDKQMLQAMLQAINIDLSSVYMTSLVKCQPPEQRAPYTSEMICCDDHLSAQIEHIRPQAIMILGEPASQQLLVSQKSLTDLRLRQHQHMGIPVYASYHPSELYNSGATKSKVWQDLLQLRKSLS